MKMRAPATPLITVDPYFSVWSPADRLNDSVTVHWTAKPNTINGYVTVDGDMYRFMGKNDVPEIGQTDSDMSALVSSYNFSNDSISLDVAFFSSLFTDDLYRLSRPVSYMKVAYCSNDGKDHKVSVRIDVSEEICIDKKGEKKTDASLTEFYGVKAAKIGARNQRILSKFGDDLRIDWGYFYLASGNGTPKTFREDDMNFVSCEADLKEYEVENFVFAYDDIKCLNYFGSKVEAYWKKSGKSIKKAIAEALDEANYVYTTCVVKSSELAETAYDAGGKEYADLLELAYRQTIAAHKLAVDDDGEVIFISKECFSNGCAATVDVTYPSSPFMLLYNTELLKGTLRPIFRFARSKEWDFDFAPHDAGTYPFVTGQRYGWAQAYDRALYESRQMPVEESGNMLIMMANIAMIDGNTDFCNGYTDLLEQWVKYLVEYGEDPANQLCTDDFAGHLAHNCNLSLKAIMGVAAYSIILKMNGKKSESRKYMDKARKMADSWSERAANSDGSFRLAFDRPGTYSMKYNIVWDGLWNTNLFKPCVINSEFSSNFRHFNAYGMPLDNRRTYTKSDWLVWTAALAGTQDEFEKYIYPLWKAYNDTPSRVPMTDWYDTVTSQMVGFRHRSVVGGLFIKLLEGKFGN